MKTLSCKSMMAVALMTLAGCSASDEINNVPNNSNISTETPITFGSYLGGSAQTRAGNTGDMTTAKLQQSGFGVFAYYTKTSTYQDQRSTATPNFMYNTQVKCSDGSSWSYSPLRYWPNDNEDENGNVTSQYVSFFTYAPYVSNLSSTETSGITSLPANNATGDPVISYSATPDNDGNIVDLLWGTANNSGSAAKSTDGTTLNIGKAYTAEAENTDTKAIKVDADMTKQKINGQVKFSFMHALSKFGGYSADPTDNSANKSGVTVDLIADGTTSTADGIYNNAQTRVTVKYINIKVQDAPASSGASATKLKTSGKFNLVTGTWSLDTPTPATASTDYVQAVNSQNAENSVTATTTTDMATSIGEPASGTTLTTDGAWSSSMPEGVTTVAKNIYTTDAKPLFILPDQTPRFVITICYVVRTLDPSLATGYTEVEQTITRNVDFSNALELNKRYNLAIHLGLTTVKFDATVADWATNTTSGTSSESSETQDVNMPLNVNE